MSQYYAYNWQVGAIDSIALQQKILANQPLSLNGVFGNLPNNTASIVAKGMVRAIAAIARGNLTQNTTFTAIGTQNNIPVVGIAVVPMAAGAAVTFTDTGQANGIPIYFDTITSITPNLNSGNAIAVGTVSATVQTPAYSIPFLVNTEKSQSYLTYSVVLNSTTAVGTIYGSLIDINQSGFNYNQLIASGVLTKIAPTVANTLVQINAAVKNIVVQITTETALTGIQFLQV